MTHPPLLSIILVSTKEGVPTAKNMVIAGDYANKGVGGNGLIAFISLGFGLKNMLILDKTTVESYEIVDEETRKSAASGVARGAVGAALLGPIGLMAGLSAKNKNTYTIALRFKDGKNSLIEIDQKIYKVLIRNLF